MLVDLAEKVHGHDVAVAGGLVQEAEDFGDVALLAALLVEHHLREVDLPVRILALGRLLKVDRRLERVAFDAWKWPEIRANSGENTGPGWRERKRTRVHGGGSRW